MRKEFSYRNACISKKTINELTVDSIYNGSVTYTLHIILHCDSTEGDGKNSWGRERHIMNR